jgi:hypothetical protein
MLPLFDMMLQAQNGSAMEAMARQYGLAQEQMTQALAALMPAFSTGLKRTASNPYDFSQLLTKMASGDFSSYFEDMSKAFSPQGISVGNDVLGQIFGSKDVSRAIAAQAAQITGIGQDILKQMLPVIATAVMGGLMKQGLGQMPATDFWSNSPQARMMEQWMQAAGFKPKHQEPASIFDNPFTQSFQAMFAPKPEPREQPANPFASNPFADFLAAMTASMAANAPKPEEKPKAEAAPAAEPAVSELVNTMFDSGLEVQKNYQKAMDSIFDTYLNAMKPGPGKK